MVKQCAKEVAHAHYRTQHALASQLESSADAFCDVDISPMPCMYCDKELAHKAVHIAWLLAVGQRSSAIHKAKPSSLAARAAHALCCQALQREQQGWSSAQCRTIRGQLERVTSTLKMRCSVCTVSRFKYTSLEKRLKRFVGMFCSSRHSILHAHAVNDDTRLWIRFSGTCPGSMQFPHQLKGGSLCCCRRTTTGHGPYSHACRLIHGCMSQNLAVQVEDWHEAARV